MQLFTSLQSIKQLHFSSLLLGVSKELLDLVSPGIPVLGLPEPARSQSDLKQSVHKPCLGDAGTCSQGGEVGLQLGHAGSASRGGPALHV